MIDIENYVVNTVITALSSLSTVTVYSDYEASSSTFPCVTVIQESNVSADTFDNGSTSENHADVLFTVTVYSNLTSGAKEEAKKILDVVDTAFEGMKFQRTLCQALPNKDDRLYRYTARYAARVGKGKTNGTTITHQIYRR